VGSWIGIGQEKGNVLGGPIGGDPKLAEWLRKVARPAGLEPATSWFVGRSEEATGGSLKPLPQVLLGFSTSEATPDSLEPLPIVSHLSVRLGIKASSKSLHVRST
jgi:hypothetical protein